MDWHAVKAQLADWARTCGFSHIGVADTDLSQAGAAHAAWLAKGYHGEMDYMAKHGSKRSVPAELVPGTLRVISVRMPYLDADAIPIHTVWGDGNQAAISRYAMGRDYHKVLRQRLNQLATHITACITAYLEAQRDTPLAADPLLHQYRVFTDSAPVLEVALAEKAGLGWRGKHTLLLSREAGSYFFLGEIYTNLPLPVDAPVEPHCGRCTACIDLCPTQAIVAPYEVDARRCISYLTIELQGSIPEPLRPLIGNRVYGCDDCQAACPWNRFAQTSTEPDFAIRHGLDRASLLDLFAWDEPTFHTRMAGSAIHRIGHIRWLRNLAVGLGNAPYSPAVVAALRTRETDPSPLVREHVLWALQRQHDKSSANG